MMFDFIVDKENFTRILNVVRSLPQKHSRKPKYPNINYNGAGSHSQSRAVLVLDQAEIF
jgi:hypothetical protein